MCRWLQVAEYCPQLCLEWLSQQVMRTKVAHTWALENLRTWVEPFLIAHNNARVRQTTAMLLVALVPSSYFRQVRARMCGNGVPFASLISAHLYITPDYSLYRLIAIYRYVISLSAHLRHHEYVSSHDVSRVI